MKKSKDAIVLRPLTKQDRLNIKRLNNGWSIHCWRMSSPHNYWMQGLRYNSQEEISSSEAFKLINYFHDNGRPLNEYNQVKTVPEYSLGFGRPSDCGKPQHTIWAHLL